MNITRLAVGAATAVTMVTLSACTTSNPPPRDPSPSTVSPPTTRPTDPVTSPTSTDPEPSPPTTSPKDLAAERAEKVLRAYYRTITECLANAGHTKATCFDDVAIGTELSNRRNSLVSAQAMKSTVTGSIEVVSVALAKVDLANKPKETPPTIPTVTFKVCRDVSRLNIVDAQGKSIVPPNRLPRAVESVSVYNYHYPKADGWRVGYVAPPVKDKSC